MDSDRSEVRKAGFPGLHLQLSPGGGSDPSTKANGGWAGQLDLFKVNSIAFYNMGGSWHTSRLKTRKAKNATRFILCVKS